jgi:glycosyltransferase involved in cell wall biosynthesis
MRKLKNIIVVYDCGTINGGAAKVAINTALDLANNRNLNIYYFCGTGPICPELQNSSVHTHCSNVPDINSGRKIKMLSLGLFNKHVYRDFLKFISPFSPSDTIIHLHGWSHSLSPSILKAIKKSKIKRVITLHDYFVVCPNGGFINYKRLQICNFSALSPKCIFCNCDKRNYLQKIWRVLRTMIQQKYLNKQENFIYLSSLSKDIIQPYFPDSNFFYYPNKISSFSFVTRDFKKKDPFLFLGRLSKEKGIELFCKAVTDGGFKGIVIGDGELLPFLKQKYPNIVFLGWMSKNQIQSILPKIKALVFPSIWYEVSPLTIPEILECHIPCIVSDCCAAKEHIINGTNGFLFKNSNEEDLIQKMKLVNSISFKDVTISKEHPKLLDIYEDVLSDSLVTK